MSSIAQKLCDEIVNPTDLKSNDIKSTVLKSTVHKSHDLKSEDLTPSERKSNDLKYYDLDSNSGVSSSNTKSASRPSISSNRSKFSGKPTRTIVIKKEKEINKIVPQGSNKAISINKFKTKETLLKKNYVDTGSNTIASGPLRCDTDCITAVRAREKCCTHAGTRYGRCCPKLQRLITNTKQIQTTDLKPYCLTDNKACTQCVETASFGMVTTPFGTQSENATPRYSTPSPSCYRHRDTRSHLSDPTSRSNSRATRLSFVEPDDRLNESRLSYCKQHRSILDSHHQESYRRKEYGHDKERDCGYASREAPKSRPDILASSYTKTTFGSCNRWSIAQYPARGPDF